MPPGSRINQSTALGQLISDAGLRIKHVCQYTGIYNRTMTEYVSGRRRPTEAHLKKLAEFFKVDPKVILGERPRPVPERVVIYSQPPSGRPQQGSPPPTAARQ